MNLMGPCAQMERINDISKSVGLNGVYEDQLQTHPYKTHQLMYIEEYFNRFPKMIHCLEKSADTLHVFQSPFWAMFSLNVVHNLKDFILGADGKGA